MKKLFVSDLDGTLLKIGNDYSAGVSEENKNIIQKYIANGNLFAIASARGHQYLPVISEMLGFTPDYIGGNGTALVIDGKVEISYLDFGFYSLLKQAVIKDSLSATVILHTENASYCEDRDAYPFGFENPLHTPSCRFHGHRRYRHPAQRCSSDTVLPASWAGRSDRSKHRRRVVPPLWGCNLLLWAM